MKARQFLPFIIFAALVGCGEKPSTPAAAPAEQAASAAAPAAVTPPAAAPDDGAVASAIAAASAGDLVKGKQVYNASCIACHAAAVMGAPKFADQASWAPRVAKGMDALYASSTNGINLMPPRGGNASLNDADLKAAVDYMISEIK